MATIKRTPFELRGADGGPLRGDVRTAGSSRPAVVICHGFKGFKDWGMFPPLAERLARAGLTAVSFNFSGSGVGADHESFSEPQRFAHDTYTRQLDDLSEVLRALSAARLVPGLGVPPKRGLFGHSRGGGVAILKTAEDPSIGALVTWSAISTGHRWDAQVVRDWRASGELEVVNSRTGDVLHMSTDMLNDLEADAGRGRLDVQGAAARIGVPWLIVHGSEDESVPLAEAETLAQANTRASLRVIRGAGHTFGARHPWRGSTRELDEAMEATVAWFGRELL
ncbi:MAG: alpha/beta fold hydrolase [Gemmatimonadetes bacterium]|nr:alpha/beta fold hydrolase [Gemmatimonadota bacterium]